MLKDKLFFRKSDLEEYNDYGDYEEYNDYHREEFMSWFNDNMKKIGISLIISVLVTFVIVLLRISMKSKKEV